MGFEDPQTVFPDYSERPAGLIGDFIANLIANLIAIYKAITGLVALFKYITGRIDQSRFYARMNEIAESCRKAGDGELKDRLDAGRKVTDNFNRHV